jgi:hypothetical protein
MYSHKCGIFWYSGYLYNAATMKGSRSAELVSQEIIRLCHAGLDSRTFRIESVKRLKKAIPVDASFFATADPATLLFTGAVLDDVLASATAQFLENECEPQLQANHRAFALQISGLCVPTPT